MMWFGDTVGCASAWGPNRIKVAPLAKSTQNRARVKQDAPASLSLMFAPKTCGGGGYIQQAAIFPVPSTFSTTTTAPYN